jgi:hypothetical protein
MDPERKVRAFDEIVAMYNVLCTDGKQSGGSSSSRENFEWLVHSCPSAVIEFLDDLEKIIQRQPVVGQKYTAVLESNKPVRIVELYDEKLHVEDNLRGDRLNIGVYIPSIPRPRWLDEDDDTEVQIGMAEFIEEHAAELVVNKVYGYY